MLAPLDPIVIPLIVIVNANALMEAPEVVMTTAVEEVALHVAARPETLLAPAATVGVTDGAKKLDGYVRVMVPPDKMPVMGVKVREMDTKGLPTTRSEKAILKKTDATLELILPEYTAFEKEHMFVCNLTPIEPFVGGPIVKPEMVMVNAD